MGCNDSAGLSSLASANFLGGTNSTSQGGGSSCPNSATVLTQYHASFLGGDSPGSFSYRGELKKPHSHVPRIVAHSSDLGVMAQDQELSVSISLQLNHESDLDEEIAAIYQPGNEKFHHFLTPKEFREKYTPTDEQIEQVKSFLLTSGIEPGSVSENHLLIRARSKVGFLNSTFYTEVHQYQDRQNKTYFAPAYELQLPANLPIQAVHGLNSFSKFKTHARMKPQVSTRAYGPSEGYSPSQIRTAYRVPTSANGAGQTLAIFELDGYTPSDIQAYERQYGLPEVPLKNILVGDATGEVGDGAGEVTLDIELMAALAPGVSQILVYEGPNNDQGVLDTYSKIANDNLAQSVSTSWGTSEDKTTQAFQKSESAVFKQMAAQGQSMYAASGDSGAYDDGTNLGVDDPASQPYIVGVGGTTLNLNSDNSYGSETTWNSGSASGAQGGGGGAGGGGISTTWTIPSWQSGVVSASSKGSTSMRNVPDVSLDANPQTGYAIYYNGSWAVFGGTSCAAPLWAAFTALVNEARLSNGFGALGFANPFLYQIGKGKEYSSDFFDISDNSTNLFYPAVKGYDDATGWGSFNGESLFKTLTQESAPSSTNSCS